MPVRARTGRGADTAGGIDPGDAPKVSGRTLPAYQRMLLPAFRFGWPSILISTERLASVMLHSILDPAGIEGKGGPDEAGVLSNDEINALARTLE